MVSKPISGQLIEVDSSVAAKAFVGIPLSLLWPYSSALVCVRAPRYKNNVCRLILFGTGAGQKRAVRDGKARNGLRRDDMI